MWALVLAVLALSLLEAWGEEADLAGDARALLVFRSAVGRHLGWNVTDLRSVCSWTGVTCEGGRVAVLRLPGAVLAGHVPAGSLGKLTALHTLSLRFNALSGSLPGDLASAGAHRSVFLNGNRLCGNFPPAILALRGLVHLALGGNDLSGTISPALGKLTSLEVLLLESNRFAGQIPELTLPQLQQFNVSFNKKLNGSIPATFWSMPRSAFLGTGLCGRPLGPCPVKASPSPAPAGKPSSPTPATNGGNGGESGRKSKKLPRGSTA